MVPGRGSELRQQERRGWRAGAEKKTGLLVLNFWMLFRDSLAPGMTARAHGREETLGKQLLVTGHANVGLVCGTAVQEASLVIT
jgi:hypothetical protein